MSPKRPRVSAAMSRFPSLGDAAAFADVNDPVQPTTTSVPGITDSGSAGAQAVSPAASASAVSAAPRRLPLIPPPSRVVGVVAALLCHCAEGLALLALEP